MEIDILLNKSGRSNLYRIITNIVLARVIPFNGAHHLKITNINKDFIEVRLPYIRRNKNHVNGIHACALATLCEYTTGLILSREFSPTNYRIILKDIQINYHFQAKMNVSAKFGLVETIVNEIKKELQEKDAIFQRCEIEVYDEQQNHICSGKIYWQIKPWSKTKVQLES
jgi:acyl-coenzyme A thioesterase PaaI-like protein